MKKPCYCTVEGLLASQCIWIRRARAGSESCAWYSLNVAFWQWRLSQKLQKRSWNFTSSSL